jgi:hypothetical protein
MICQMIGIFLYCGAATQPLAMFPQSNNTDTGYMAQQMIQSGKYNAATITPLQRLIDCGKKNDGRKCAR